MVVAAGRRCPRFISSGDRDMTTVAPEAEAATGSRPLPGSVPGGLGPPWLTVFLAAAGLPWQRRLARAALKIPRIRYWEKQYDKLSDAELRTAGLRLRGRGRGGETLDQLLPEAFGLVCVASKRV